MPKVCYRITYNLADPTLAEYGAGQVGDIVIYRYASSYAHAEIIARHNLPPRYVIGHIEKDPKGDLLAEHKVGLLYTTSD